MNDIQKLIALQRELEDIGERLGNLFAKDHPRCMDVFEDIGAAGYYLKEAGYRLDSAKITLGGCEDK